MATIGNMATLLCFILCLILDSHLAGGSDVSIVLTPILLLLNQDYNMSGFGNRQRYFPVTAAVSGYLIVSAGCRLWIEVHHGYQSSDWGMQTGGPGLFFILQRTYSSLPSSWQIIVCLFLSFLFFSTRSCRTISNCRTGCYSWRRQRICQQPLQPTLSSSDS